MSSNLNFNIEKTIQITEGQPEVDTFVSMEVRPDLKVDQAGDTVNISGKLHVFASYRGAEEQESDELSPFVTDEEELDNQQLQEVNREFPVSISIPSYRIRSLDEITTDIDSVDYQLLSSRELTVSVSLAITGLQEEARLVEKDADEEEIVVVHRAPFYRKPEGAEVAGEEHPIHAQKQEQEKEQEDHVAHGQEEQAEESEAEEHPLAMSQSDTQEIRPENEEDVPVMAEAEVTAMLSDESDQEREPEPEQKVEEVKVAISSKKQASEPVTTQTLVSMFTNKKSTNPSAHNEEIEAESRGTQTAHEPEPIENKNDKRSTPNTLDWKRMMIRDEKEQSFRSIKMVIVSKNHTLDDIAQKYNMTASKLIQFNRLDSAELEEGQILYVPNT